MISGDFGSIFYTQTRIGKNGKEFKLFKFRSMVVNADEELEKILKENKELAKEYNKNKKLSIDELQQVLNILFNQMIFIVNRPYLPR